MAPEQLRKESQITQVAVSVAAVDIGGRGAGVIFGLRILYIQFNHGFV